MNVLPLIHRELLVGARRRSTYWLRVVIALGSTALGALLLWSIMRGGGFGGMGTPGMALFSILVWLGLGAVGLFGVFFAADAVSSERREGTLGLLFLTGLRSYDVVLGKLSSTTLRAAFTLMAALPVIALPLLMGGVTFKSYGLVAGILGNTLFLSVAVGLAMSSLSRQPVRAVLTTLFVMIAITGGTVWIDFLIADYRETRFEAWASFLSPGYAIFTAVFGGSVDIWNQLALQHTTAWLMLAVAVLGTGRLTERTRQAPRKRITRWLLGTTETAAQRRLRDRRPIAWLTQRRARLPTMVALTILVALGGWSTWLMLNGDFNTWWMSLMMANSILGGLFSFVLTVWMAAEATRRVGDARREGALELILATPLTVRELVGGMWWGLSRVFGVALMVVLIVMAIGSALMLYQYIEMLSTTANFGAGFSAWDYFVQQAINSAFSLTNTVIQAAALIWVGLWLGLRMERPAQAIAVTWLLVVLAPGVLQIVVQIVIQIVGMASSLANPMRAMWMGGIARGGVGLLVNIAFIVWARRNLMNHFREAASGTFRPRGLKVLRKLHRPPPLPGRG